MAYEAEIAHAKLSQLGVGVIMLSVATSYTRKIRNTGTLMILS